MQYRIQAIWRTSESIILKIILTLAFSNLVTEMAAFEITILFLQDEFQKILLGDRQERQ